MSYKYYNPLVLVASNNSNSFSKKSYFINDWFTKLINGYLSQ